MQDKIITIALPKGRLMVDCLNLLKASFGEDVEIDESSRKLMFDFEKQGLRLLAVKPVDIPTYVESGVADIGIAGKDVLLEQEKDIYEPVDLKFGYCRLVVAGWSDNRAETSKNWSKVRVATKYPNITEWHFSRKGIPVEVIKLYGSVELAPLVNLSSKIVDLVSSGETLRQNNLKEEETIFDATARLVVNRASHKLKYERIKEIIEQSEKYIYSISKK